MSFLKTFLARPLAWLTALAVGAGGGLLIFLADYVKAAQEHAAAGGGIDAVWQGAVLGIFAKLVGALMAKYGPKPIVPPVEPEAPEPEPPSSRYVR